MHPTNEDFTGKSEQHRTSRVPKLKLSGTLLACSINPNTNSQHFLYAIIFTCIYIHTYGMCIYIYNHIQYMYLHTYIHAYIHTYIHAYMCIHTRADMRQEPSVEQAPPFLGSPGSGELAAPVWRSLAWAQRARGSAGFCEGWNLAVGAI